MTRQTSLPAITRRLFLQQSVLALAAAMSPSFLLAAPQTTAPLRTLLAFSADDYHLLSVVSEACIPSEAALPGAQSIDLAARIDRYTSPQDTDLIQGIRGALQFIEYKAPELIGESTTFSHLDPKKQEKVLRAMNGASPLTTTIFTAVRGLCIFYFATDEAGWKVLGYDGPLLFQSTASRKAGA